MPELSGQEISDALREIAAQGAEFSEAAGSLELVEHQIKLEAIRLAKKITNAAFPPRGISAAETLTIKTLYVICKEAGKAAYLTYMREPFTTASSLSAASARSLIRDVNEGLLLEIAKCLKDKSGEYARWTEGAKEVLKIAENKW